MSVLKEIGRSVKQVDTTAGWPSGGVEKDDYAKLLKLEQWRERKRKNDIADGELLDRAQVIKAISAIASGAKASLDSIGPKILLAYPDVDQLMYDGIISIIDDVKRAIAGIRLNVGDEVITGERVE